MDGVTSSRRNNAKQKGNKENSQPAGGGEPSGSRGGKASVVPLQLRGNTTSRAALSGYAVKKIKPDAKEFKRPTHSQVLQKQAAKHQKAATVPPTAAPSSKSALGTYKGRVVQSKIGFLWKSSDSLSTADPKPQNPQSENVAKKSRSQSAALVSRHGLQNPALIRSKSVSDKPVLATKASSVNGRRAGVCSGQPPARTVTSARSRNTNVAPVDPRGNQKPKVPAVDKEVHKPAVTSTLSQYRCSMETAEERRARLAEWLASKGKTLKRPAMMAAPSKLKVPAKAEVQLSVAAPVMAAELHTHNLQSEASAHDADDAPGTKDTTLDLLDSFDADPQDRVDDVVMNLCDALEAMVTPSGCSDDIPQVEDGCDADPTRVKLEESSEQLGLDMKVAADEPEMSSASVIKYSVKTTPFLQSVKKTMDEASTSTRKSNIKDLKFLTPVRRSCRIQRKLSHLPAMLVDPDPCVSSLAELVKLNDDTNAYVYRKNPALLQELPDQGP
uniref:Cytoskeleton associated protein 2 n=1 Tax=Nothobranchius furzeri TaxID=105023 RepID=A0A1A8VC67_NOTFU